VSDAMRGRVENPVMIFLIKKRINTELFIEIAAAIFTEETRIRVVTIEGDQQVAASCWVGHVYLALKCYLCLKRCRNERSYVNLL